MPKASFFPDADQEKPWRKSIMHILVIGSNGQLGSDVMRLAPQFGHIVSGVDVPDIDITSVASVAAVFAANTPDAVINCAAYTAVDACETAETIAYKINALGVRNLANACTRAKAMLVHYSTDYVFDGTARSPLVETDKVNPQSAYGRTKLAGEQMLAEACENHLIFRIAWLYGTNGVNFVKTIRSVAQKNRDAKKPLRVVNDQWGTPTYTRQVVRQTLRAMESKERGIFHSTNEGACTWFDFAKVIVDRAGIAVDVEPCTTAEFPRPAPRPAYSVLENRRLKELGLHCMDGWQAAFNEFLMDETA